MQHIRVQLILPPVEKATCTNQIIEQLLHINLTTHATEIQSAFLPSLTEFTAFATGSQLFSLTTRTYQTIGYIVLLTFTKFIQ